MRQRVVTVRGEVAERASIHICTEVGCWARSETETLLLDEPKSVLKAVEYLMRPS